MNGLYLLLAAWILGFYMGFTWDRVKDYSDRKGWEDCRGQEIGD